MAKIKMPKIKMLKKTLSTVLLLTICSCGFQVIYKERGNESDISYVKELAAIKIKKDRDRVSQELKNNLYDLLNPDYVKTEPKYFLILTNSESISPTFITSTGSSGRNKITLNASYILRDLNSAAIIATGTTSVNDNYDLSTSRFGTYTAENYIRNNLTKLAAQNIRNSLVNDLIEMKKKCDAVLKIEDKSAYCKGAADNNKKSK